MIKITRRTTPRRTLLQDARQAGVAGLRGRTSSGATCPRTSKMEDMVMTKIPIGMDVILGAIIIVTPADKDMDPHKARKGRSSGPHREDSDHDLTAIKHPGLIQRGEVSLPRLNTLYQ